MDIHNSPVTLTTEKIISRIPEQKTSTPNLTIKTVLQCVVFDKKNYTFMKAIELLLVSVLERYHLLKNHITLVPVTYSYRHPSHPDPNSVNWIQIIYCFLLDGVWERKGDKCVNYRSNYQVPGDLQFKQLTDLKNTSHLLYHHHTRS